MKFKAGQRVKIVGPVPKAIDKPFVGVETVITGPEYDELGFIGYPTAFTDALGRRGVLAKNLAPLTDPGFESFMERIQKPLTKPEWEAA